MRYLSVGSGASSFTLTAQELKLSKTIPMYTSSLPRTVSTKAAATLARGSARREPSPQRVTCRVVRLLHASRNFDTNACARALPSTNIAGPWLANK